jgi:hypothetical protein
MQLGEFEATVEDLSQTVNLGGEDPLLPRGAVLKALKDGGASLDFTAALGLDAVDSEIYRQRALSWQAFGEGDAAIADLGLPIRLEPDWPGLCSDRAEICGQRGDDPGVISDKTLAKFWHKTLVYVHRCEVVRVIGLRALTATLTLLTCRLTLSNGR